MRSIIFKNLYDSFESIIFCPRNKFTGEYIDERYNPTKDVTEAIGWKTKEECQKDIDTLDSPKEWEIVLKHTTINIGKD